MSQLGEYLSFHGAMTRVDEVRIAIVSSFTIYVLSGHELFRRRKQFAQFQSSSGSSTPAIENPFTSFKTTEVQITTELASPRLPGDDSSQIELQPELTERQYLSRQKEYEQYSITIERGLATPMRQGNMMNEDEIRLRGSVMAANRAAWSYTKCCALFFFSLMITWIPSSLFRAYTLVHPATSNFGIAYAAGLVLPLMGFWNFVIYVTISWDAVLDLFAGDIDKRVWKQWHGHWVGTQKPREWQGSSRESWSKRSRGFSLNSKDIRGR